MKKQCVICNKTFSLKPSHFDKLFCCSRECSREYPLYKVIRRLENKLNEPLESYLRREYTDNQRSYRWLIKELGINNKTVPKLLNKYGIEIRSGSEAVKTQWNNNPERRILSKKLLEEYITPMVTNDHPRTISDEEIIRRLVDSDFEYISRYGKNKVKIKCKKCDTKYIRKPDVLCNKKVCFACAKNSKGEYTIKELLVEKGIEFTQQVKFEDCVNVRPLPFDFGIYSKNELLFLIEYDGKQHFDPECGFGGKDNLQGIRKNDTIKTVYCIENGIPLLRINHKQNVKEVLTNTIKLVI